MIKLFQFIAVLFMLTIFSACVSFEYTGKTEQPTDGDVRVFEDSAKIKKRYTVLGQATVSGNYQDVSRDRMIKKLTEEAKKCGANAILLIEQQVIEAGHAASGARFMTAFDYDDTNSSWSQIYKDVDQNFANTRREKSRPSSGANNDYRRVIRAEFLKYTE